MIVAPAKKYFVVRRSAIAGLGAFAICDIRKGTRIVEYTGERISTAEAARRARRRKRVVFFEVSSRTLIDAAVGGGPAHRINHSCEGNCDTFATARGRIIIAAIRDIQAGEELTYDYRLELEEGATLAAAKKRYPCRCGAPRCRGTMVDLGAHASPTGSVPIG
jgi:SET domain-containing protein